MTDPLAFLQAAHARAEQAAQEATPGPWIAGSSSPHLVDEVVYGQSDWPPGNLQHTCDTTYSGKHARPNAAHIALHNPAAVLRRIHAERKILAEHANDYGDCTRCAGDDGEVVVNGMSHPLRTCVPHPCATIRALAEAWGWQEGQG